MATSSTYRDLDSLEREIRRLTIKAKRMEKQMDDNLDYLQENYTGMLFNSILPLKSKKKGWASGFVSILTGNPRLQQSLGRLADYLAEKATEGLDTLFSRFFGKKEH
jgi:hypothetical protein